MTARRIMVVDDEPAAPTDFVTTSGLVLCLEHPREDSPGPFAISPVAVSISFETELFLPGGEGGVDEQHTDKAEENQEPRPDQGDTQA